MRRNNRKKNDIRIIIVQDKKGKGIKYIMKKKMKKKDEEAEENYKNENYQLPYIIHIKIYIL